MKHCINFYKLIFLHSQDLPQQYARNTWLRETQKAQKKSAKKKLQQLGQLIKNLWAVFNNISHFRFVKEKDDRMQWEASVGVIDAWFKTGSVGLCWSVGVYVCMFARFFVFFGGYILLFVHICVFMFASECVYVYAYTVHTAHFRLSICVFVWGSFSKSHNCGPESTTIDATTIQTPFSRWSES